MTSLHLTLVRREFDDDVLRQVLFGPQNINLYRIERKLGVRVTMCGNVVTISGSAASAKAAGSALDTLYERLCHGQVVQLCDIDAAVQMCNSGLPGAVVSLRTRKRHVIPHSVAQAKYLQAMQEHELVFCLGPAGTGKTYLAVAMAVTMMLQGQIERLVLSRPAVEAGERLGFLPGDVQEKVDPYFRPLYDALYDLLPREQIAKHLSAGDIEVAPLAFMRGRTLANAFIILDEAQNTTSVQMKMFLTRLGKNARMVVTGDLSQVDLPSSIPSGLHEAVKVLEGVNGIAFIHFSDLDIVRHSLVSRIIRAYTEFGL